MTVQTLTVQWLAEALVVARLPAGAPVPALPADAFWSLTRTHDELSLVVSAQHLPPGTQAAESGWCALQVIGPLDFSMVGVLASIAQPLAAARISIFALSTFDTDYILLKSDTASAAEAILKAEGFRFQNTRQE